MAAAGSIVTARSDNRVDLAGLSLVLGLGASGVSAVRFIDAHGGVVRALDSRAQPPGLAAVAKLGVEVVTESLDPKYLADVSRVILSPGLSIDLPICQAARERGIEVLNDIELFARQCEAPVLAVTGSNGKSTVATLLAQLLEAAGVNAPAGGNLGTPALDLLERSRDGAPADAYVLEISSFQMEAAQSLAPLAAAVLNVSADHLDRHPNIEIYAGLKEKLLRDAATAVVNADDPIVAAMGRRHRAAIEFSTLRTLAGGYSTINTPNGEQLARDGVAVLPVAELAMVGRHNVANALAALALADASLRADGPLRRTVANEQADPTGAMLDVLRRFRGLPHRCEFVAEVEGVTYVNDSKATNVGASAAALAGFDGPVVLIAGGQGKGADFSELPVQARGKMRAVITIGAAAKEIAAVFAGECPVVHAQDMREAVRQANAQSRPGDTVLLSPACASLDMFENYAARGHAFAAAVRELRP